MVCTGTQGQMVAASSSLNKPRWNQSHMTALQDGNWRQASAGTGSIYGLVGPLVIRSGMKWRRALFAGKVGSEGLVPI